MKLDSVLAINVKVTRNVGEHIKDGSPNSG